MRTSQIQAIIQCVATMHERNGASKKAELLRGFSDAIAPLANANISELIAVLTCEQRVDNR